MSSWRRALASVALVATAVPLGALAAMEPAAAGANCPAAPAGTIRVGMVVDAGSGPVGVICVVLPAGSTGRDALEARARALGRALRWHDSGLLCAIDGLPQTGCGQANADGFAYWSYWSATGSDWTYMNLGPAFRRLKDGDVEGWRFLDGGAGTGSDRAPRAAVDDGRPTSPTTTLPPAPAPTAPPAVQGVPGRAPAVPPTTARPRPGAAPTTAVPGAGSPTTVTTPETSVEPTPELDPGEAAAPPGDEPEGPTTTERTGPEIVDERSAAPAIAESRDDGSWAGVATAAGLVVLLGGAATVTVARRRRDLAPEVID